MVGDVRRETANQKGYENQRGRRTRTCADGRVDMRERNRKCGDTFVPTNLRLDKKRKEKKKHQASGRDDYSRHLVTKVPANEWAIFSSIASIVPSLEWQKSNKRETTTHTKQSVLATE